MGLKDMFRSGGSKAQKSSSPHASVKGSRAGSSPKDSLGNSFDRSAADGISVCSSASATSYPGMQQNEDTRAHEDALKRIATLEKELSHSRWETMKTHEQIAQLEKKVREADGGAWQTFPSEEQSRAQSAVEERNKQLREKVRELQEEVERLREGRSSASSDRADDNEDDIDDPQSLGSLPGSAYAPGEIEAMATRIRELERELEEKNGQEPDLRSDGMAAQIKALEAMLDANQEDAQELMRERDQLREALQDAG